MKASIIASTFAVVASALTSKVTRYTYITIDLNGDKIGDASSSYVPHTLLRMARNGSYAFNVSNSSNLSSSSRYSSYLPASVVISTVEGSDAYSVPSPSPPPPLIHSPDSFSSWYSAPTDYAEEESMSMVTQESEASYHPDPDQDLHIVDYPGFQEDFKREIRAAHNQKRALHGASPLFWSFDLETEAEAYAVKYQCGDDLVHPGSQKGENLAYGYESATATVEAWYSEGVNYDYSTANVFDHFTQVIWKSSKHLGCAYKDCGGLYVICLYDPAGNVVGQGPQNLS